MATEDPSLVVKKGPQSTATSDAKLDPAKGGSTPPVPWIASLSIEDAERFASRIRPSWESADEAPPKSDAPPKSHDTIIEVIPTVPIGGVAEPGHVAAGAARAGAAPTAPATPARPSATIPDTASAAPAVKSEARVEAKSTPEAKPEPKPRAADEPPRASKTRVGVGDDASSKPAKTQHDGVSKSTPEVATATPATAAPGARGDVTDDVQLPITNASKPIVAIAIGAVAVIGVIVAAVVLFGRGSSKTPEPSAPIAAVPAATTAPAPTVAPAPAPSAAPASDTATAAPATVTPATAEPAPSAAPRAAESKPAPEPKAEPKKAGGEKPAAKPAKRRGGIIRDAPF